MCGICGMIGPNASEATIRTMLGCMALRGPDGEGIWQDEHIVFGHRRLAIVDLTERGAQPLISSDKRFIATINGEIYNYPELRRELEEQGAVFQSDCDAEVVLHGFRAWGTASFARYNGMFVFGLWDAQEQTFYLVRDRMGIKPVYYFNDGDNLLFASDVRAIIAATKRNEWPIDTDGLLSYLLYQNRFGEETMFDGIKLLAPGRYLYLRNGQLSSRAFFDITLPEKRLTCPVEAVERFKNVAGAAVARHLMSDVPRASYLSAGFDSSYVTSLASRIDPAIISYTGCFSKGGWYDEAEGAALTANALGIVNIQVPMDAATFKDVFDEVVFALEEPRMGMGALSQYVVAREAARRRKVILTGHGGDELFSGYPVFKFFLLKRFLKESPQRFVSLLRKVRKSELPHLVYFSMARLFGRRYRPYVPVLFRHGELCKGMKPELLPSLRRRQNESRSRPFGYEQLFLAYLKDYLPGLLVVEDKISMAHSLESRTPLLDNELLGLSASISEELKIEGGELKRIIKRAAQDMLPDALFAMPKRGFPTPLASWLRGELRTWMQERLKGETSSLRRLFHPAYLETVTVSYLKSWRRHIRPLDEIQTHQMWMLLCLESWLRQYQKTLGVTLFVKPVQGTTGER